MPTMGRLRIARVSVYDCPRHFGKVWLVFQCVLLSLGRLRITNDFQTKPTRPNAIELFLLKQMQIPNQFLAVLVCASWISGEHFAHYLIQDVWKLASL